MVVTNLVVALMIVSNVSERVMAFEVNECYLENHPDVTRWFPNEFPLKPEPMIRERSVTNFVYSTRINTELIDGYCPKCENGSNVFPVGEFYGKPIHGIWFEGMPWILCEKCRSEQARMTTDWIKKVIGD